MNCWATYFQGYKVSRISRIFENLQNIYPQNCKIAYSPTAYHLFILKTLFTKYSV